MLQWPIIPKMNIYIHDSDLRGGYERNGIAGAEAHHFPNYRHTKHRTISGAVGRWVILRKTLGTPLNHNRS